MAALVAAPVWAKDEPPYDPLSSLDVTELSTAELTARGILVADLGEIDFPTGRILAADFYYLSDQKPFAASMPSGSYAVRLWTVLEDPTRAALLSVEVNACQATRWLNARTEGLDTLQYALAGDLAYPVDSGTGSFADASLIPVLREEVENFSGTDDVIEGLANRPAVIVERDGVRLVAAASGWGDGVYASYWGTDDTGCICRLVTDFGVLWNGWPQGGDHELHAPQPQSTRVAPVAMMARATCGTS